MCRPPGQRSPPALRRRVPVNPGRRAGDAARVTATGRAAGRATVDLPPRPPKEAWSGIRRKRRCDPARRPQARPRRFTSWPGPRRCHSRRPRRLGLDALPQNRSRRGCCQRRQCCPGTFLAHRSVGGGSATAPRSSLGVTRLLQCLGGLRSRSDCFRCISPPGQGWVGVKIGGIYGTVLNRLINILGSCPVK